MIVLRPRGIRIKRVTLSGLGDAAADFLALAAQYPPTSALSQHFAYCATNPSDESCSAAATQANLTVPFQSTAPLTASQQAAITAAQAQGVAPPTITQSALPPLQVIAPTVFGPAGSYHPTAQLRVPRGGSVFYPGDTWSIVITGGQPNAPVKVVGGMNGQQNTVVYGTTDANGNFTLSGIGRAHRRRGSLRGTFSQSDVGSWSETWYVGNDVAGSFTFQVQPSTTAPTNTPPTTYHPKVAFHTSRSGSVLYPGDSWSIVITGGQPNAPVKVVGGMNGQQNTVVYGTTDANGNFTLSGIGRAHRRRGSLRGTFSQSDVGSWSETWYVGNDVAGSFTFQVQPSTTAPTNTPPTTYHPKVAFHTSRSGSVLYPGDSWTISITGGQPNAPVKVVGGVNGQQNTVVYGTTDANGNFTLSGIGRAHRRRGSLRGTFSQSDVGSWSETWYVGNDLAGSFTFQVQPSTTPSSSETPAPTATPTNSPTAPGSSPGPLSDLISAGAGLFDSVSSTAKTIQSDVGLASVNPVIFWGGAAALGLFLFHTSKGRKHRS